MLHESQNSPAILLIGSEVTVRLLWCYVKCCECLEVGVGASFSVCHNYQPSWLCVPGVLQVPRRTTVNASKPPKNATYAAPRQDCSGIFARLQPWSCLNVEEPTGGYILTSIFVHAYHRQTGLIWLDLKSENREKSNWGWTKTSSAHLQLLVASSAPQRKL